MAQTRTGVSGNPGGGSLPPLSLPLHTRLGEFEIVDVIGEGGFSIVYLAQDHQLERTVAIKEYLPGAIAFRNAEGLVQPRFGKYEATFRTGLRSFLKEARILAQFEHHALIRIHRFWEQNGTAYMAMQYCQGQTLRQLLQSDPARGADEAWLKRIIAPVLDALELLHSRSCYHRDLSPDNIMILSSGLPMLLDFGAARQVIGDMTQALTVILKPGFAPVEQYADDESMKQGPWTDIYGVGAVLYHAVTGRSPTASVARLVKDPLKKLLDQPEVGITPCFAAAIDHALALFPTQRPQSITEFRAELMASQVQPEVNVQALSAASIDEWLTSANPTIDPALTPLSTIQSAPPAADEPVRQAQTEAGGDPASLVLGLEPRAAPPQAHSSMPVEPDMPAPGSTDAAEKAERPQSSATASPAGMRRSQRLLGVSVALATVLILLASLAYLYGDDPQAGQVVAQEGSAADAARVRLEPPRQPPDLVEAPLEETPMESAQTGEMPPPAEHSGRVPPPAEEVTPLLPRPPVTPASSPVVREPVRAPAATASDGKSVPEARGSAAPMADKPGAMVRLSIRPWGRVSVDGEEKGDSPPLVRLRLPVGTHTVVITNEDFPPYRANVNIVDKQDVSVSHRFGN